MSPLIYVPLKSPNTRVPPPLDLLKSPNTPVIHLLTRGISTDFLENTPSLVISLSNVFLRFLGVLFGRKAADFF